MNVNINDITYSYGSGEYSALNSKLYLMDEIEASMDEGVASNATMFSSDGAHGAGTGDYEIVESELGDPHLGYQGDLANNMGELVPGDQQADAASQLSSANPISNTINAATSGSPVVSLDNDKVQEIADAYAENLAVSTVGNSAGGSNEVSATSNSSSLANGASNNTTVNAVENVFNTVDNLTEVALNQINEISENINTTINNSVTDVTNILDETVINNVDNKLNEFGDEITNIAGPVTNITNETFTEVSENIESITNEVNQDIENITTTINENIENIAEMFDTPGPIEYSLDVSGAIDPSIGNNINASDLSGTFSDLNDSLARQASFEISSDFINFDINSQSIEESDAVTNTQTTIEDGLSSVDGVVDNTIVNDMQIDPLSFSLPTDEISGNGGTSGNIDPSDGLSTSNDTALSEDLGTEFLSDDNVLDNSLSMDTENQDNLIEDVVGVNENSVDINDNQDDMSEDVNSIAEDSANDAMTDVSNENNTNGTDTNLDNINEEINNIADDIVSNASNTGGENSTILDNLIGGDESNEASGIGEGDAIYDALATTADQTDDVVTEEVNNVDMGNDSVGDVVDVINDSGLLGDNLGI